MSINLLDRTKTDELERRCAGIPEWGAGWPKRWKTTRWSLVHAAAQGSATARRAFDELYKAYFNPVFSLIAARHGQQRAQEWTQEFFAERLVFRGDLRNVEPGRGRFRSWLFASVQNFVKNRWRFDRRQCRDVRKTTSIDSEGDAVGLLSLRGNPERQFNRSWALAVLSVVLGRLRHEYCSQPADTAELHSRFETLKVFLPGPELAESSYAASAATLGMTSDAVKQLVYRLRHRFAALLREEVSRMVRDPADVEQEIRFLCDALEPPDPPESVS